MKYFCRISLVMYLVYYNYSNATPECQANVDHATMIPHSALLVHFTIISDGEKEQCQWTTLRYKYDKVSIAERVVFYFRVHGYFLFKANISLIHVEINNDRWCILKFHFTSLCETTNMLIKVLSALQSVVTEWLRQCWYFQEFKNPKFQ